MFSYALGSFGSGSLGDRYEPSRVIASGCTFYTHDVYQSQRIFMRYALRRSGWILYLHADSLFLCAIRYSGIILLILVALCPFLTQSAARESCLGVSKTQYLVDSANRDSVTWIILLSLWCMHGSLHYIYVNIFITFRAVHVPSLNLDGLFLLTNMYDLC